MLLEVWPVDHSTPEGLSEMRNPQPCPDLQSWKVWVWAQLYASNKLSQGVPCALKFEKVP